MSFTFSAGAVAQDPVGDADFKAGYALGKVQGEEWASLGQNMPEPRGLEFLATGQAANIANTASVDSWKMGFKAGYANGFSEAKASGRPATAEYEKYDQRSYWAGYKSGFGSTHVVGDERTRMFRRCDVEIVTHHYIKKDYDSGFVAGVADADKQDEQKRTRQAEVDRKQFLKKSYEAGYRAEKELHKHNGIPRSIDESIELSREAQKWDTKSWEAGYRAANEEDTRP
jgi:hypothetical protein